MVRDKLLIIADDLTGANDTGVQFSKNGYRTVVLTDKERIRRAIDEFDVVVIDTESRGIDSETARREVIEVGEISKELKIRHVYKKLDSTLRGNVGAELSGLMHALDAKCTIVVPALPAQGRITIDGKVYIHGKPLKEPFIPSIIARQSDVSIEVIPIDIVRSGKERLDQVIGEHISNSASIIVIDAKKDQDLELIASSLPDIKVETLVAGSSGLAAFLSGHLGEIISKRINMVIAGSTSETTMKQIKYASRHPAVEIIDVDTGKIIAGERDTELRRIVSRVKESASRGEDIIIRSAPSQEYVSQTLESGRASGSDHLSTGEAIADFLGDLVRHLLEEMKVNGICLTGGDIAKSVLRHLEVEGLIPEGEVLPGIPYGHFFAGSHRELRIVTKAGGFGPEDAIMKVLNALNNSLV